MRSHSRFCFFLLLSTVVLAGCDGGGDAGTAPIPTEGVRITSAIALLAPGLPPVIRVELDADVALVPSEIGIDWNENGQFESSERTPIEQVPADFILTGPIASSGDIATIETRQLRWRLFRGPHWEALSGVVSYRVGINGLLEVTGAPRLQQDELMSPAQFVVEEGTLVVIDPEGDAVRFEVRTLEGDVLAAGPALPLTVPASPLVFPGSDGIDMQLWAAEASEPSAWVAVGPMLRGIVTHPCPCGFGVHLDEAEDQIMKEIAIDDAGNLFILLTFADATDFGGGVRQPVQGKSTWELLSLDATGAYRWDTVLGGPALDSGEIRIQPDGRILIGLTMNSGSEPIGGGPAPIANGWQLIEVSATGVVSARPGFPFRESCALAGFAVGAGGEIGVVGTWSNGADWGSGPHTRTAPGSGNGGYLIGYRADGTLIGERTLQVASASVQVQQVVSVANGEWIVGGQIVKSVPYSIDMGNGPQFREGHWAAFVARYDEDGLWQWDRFTEGNAESTFAGMGQIPGGVAVAGAFAVDTPHFAPTTFVDLGFGPRFLNGQFESYAWWISEDSVPIRDWISGSSGIDLARDIVTTASGEVIVSVSSKTDWLFAGQVLPGGGELLQFSSLVAFDTAGNPRWGAPLDGGSMTVRLAASAGPFAVAAGALAKGTSVDLNPSSVREEQVTANSRDIVLTVFRQDSGRW